MRPPGKGWMLYAFGSAIFASLTAILGKVGIQGVESNLGTAIRTGVVLVMAWVMVLVTGKANAVRQVPGRELAFICLSGIATGASWLCYYRALQDGPASVVVPIDKLSILVTVAFSGLVFHERLTRRSGLGLAPDRGRDAGNADLIHQAAGLGPAACRLPHRLRQTAECSAARSGRSGAGRPQAFRVPAPPPGDMPQAKGTQALSQDGERPIPAGPAGRSRAGGAAATAGGGTAGPRRRIPRRR